MKESIFNKRAAAKGRVSKVPPPPGLDGEDQVLDRRGGVGSSPGDMEAGLNALGGKGV